MVSSFMLIGQENTRVSSSRVRLSTPSKSSSALSSRMPCATSCPASSSSVILRYGRMEKLLSPLK